MDWSSETMLGSGAVDLDNISSSNNGSLQGMLNCAKSSECSVDISSEWS